MSRRTNISPSKLIHKMVDRAVHDPRDDMVRKLQEELIILRGRERELALSENMLKELYEKMRLLQAEKVKADEEGKFTIEQTHKTINQLKKDIDLLKAELKSCHNELTEVEEEESDLKRSLNNKNIEIEKLRKESYYLLEDSEKLQNEYQKHSAQCDDVSYDNKRLYERIADYEGRNSEITKKIQEVKGYLGELQQEHQVLKEKLKSYENENMGINDDLEQKESKIDHLEVVYGEKHEEIRNYVENFIELEHQNEKSLKETKHKMNLLKIENEKYNELNSAIAKVERKTRDEEEEVAVIKDDIAEVNRVNKEFLQQNEQLRRDLANCQDHLQNLLKSNSLLQVELDSMLKQDDAVISVLRRKKVMPSLENYQSIRSSRQEYRSNAANNTASRY